MTDRAEFRARIHEAMEDLDAVAAEFARDDMRPEFSTDMIDLYRIHGDWMRRALVIDVVQDQSDPALEEIIVDFLRAPGRGEDWSDFTKAACLYYLTGERFHDRPAADLYAGIDAELSRRGLTLA